MVKIRNFVYCMNVNRKENSTDIIGVLSCILPKKLPYSFSFSISFDLVGLEEGTHKISMEFVSPSKEIISSVSNGEINLQKENIHDIPISQFVINILASLQNVELNETGTYTTKVYLDDEIIGEYDIYVQGRGEEHAD